MNKKSFRAIVPMVLFFLSFWKAEISAQTTEKSHGFKLYTNFSWENPPSIYLPSDSASIGLEIKALSLGYFSPSYTYRNARTNFHEFELSKIQLSRKNISKVFILKDSNETFPGDLSSNLDIRVRYEYNIRILKKRVNSIVRPYIGFSFNPFLNLFQVSPLISTDFNQIIYSGGMNFSLIPRIEIRLKGIWFLDLNIPLQVSDLRLTSGTLQDPSLPPNAQTITTLDINFFPRIYQARIGFGASF